MLAAESRVPTGNGRAQRNETEPTKGFFDGPTFGVRQALFREQLFAGNNGVINPVSRIIQEPAVVAGVKVVDQDVGVYEEADRCHARISFKKAASD